MFVAYAHTMIRDAGPQKPLVETVLVLAIVIVQAEGLAPIYGVSRGIQDI